METTQMCVYQQVKKNVFHRYNELLLLRDENQWKFHIYNNMSEILMYDNEIGTKQKENLYNPINEMFRTENYREIENSLEITSGNKSIINVYRVSFWSAKKIWE